MRAPNWNNLHSQYKPHGDIIDPMSAKTPSWERLHEIAHGQAGHFTTEQAADAGFSPQLLYKHVQSGNLQRAMRGIYRIGSHPPGEHEELVVLWLWSDRRAVFSHETALQLHDLSDALPAYIHLTLPAETSRRRKIPGGVVAHFADVPLAEREWIGPVPVTTAARAIRDVAATHGDASMVARAIDQGIRDGLFLIDDVAPAASYVADAQGWGLPVRPWGVDDRTPDADGLANRGIPHSFYGQHLSGVCTEAPPPDWPTVVADLGRDIGAHLRVARYLPSRTMLLEFVWPIEDAPDEQQLTVLHDRLSERFSWA